MKKILFTLMIMAILACPAMAARYRQHQVTIVDEFGDPVTNIDQIEIFDVGTATTSTIYPTRAGGTMTNPITPTSTASTFDVNLGLVRWFQAAPGYKITVTESGASISLTIDNRSEGDTRFPFYASYIGAAATLQTTDTANLDIGTDDDFVHDWDNDNSRYVIFPGPASAPTDGGRIDFGKAGKHTDIYWHTGAAVTDDYVFFDEGSANVFFKDVDLVLDSSAVLFFGDSSDMSINYDESNNDLDILSDTALDEISFGASGDGYDLVWHATTGLDYILFDYSEEELGFVGTDLFLDDDSDLVLGSDDDWRIESDTGNTLDITPLQVSDETAIINLGADTNGVDLKLFVTASGDFWHFDASVGDFICEDANVMLMDNSDLIFGDSDDFILQTTGATQLDLTSLLTTEVVAFDIGTDQAGIDVNLFGGVSGDYVRFDASRGDMLFEDVNIVLMDDTDLAFGDSNDFTIVCTAASQLDIASVLTTEVVAIDVGADQAGIDVNFFGGVTGDFVRFDASRGDMLFEDVNIVLMDDTDLAFGDSNDFTIQSTSASQLDIATVLTNEVVAIDIGADQAGVDVNLFGTTSGAVVRFDASADEAIFDAYDIGLQDEDTLGFGDGDDVTMRYDEATKDALLVAGFVVGAKRLVINATASRTVDANECGALFLNQNGESGGTAAKVVFTLPGAEAGLWYTFIDANQVAAADCNITAAGGDTINNGGAAGNWAHEVDGDDFAQCTLLAIDTTSWIFLDDSNDLAEWVDGS